MSSCNTSVSLARQIAAFGARTTVVTLRAPHRLVFNFLADIESLPRWAGGFCESLWLGQGRWMALTSLGELFVALEADSRAGEIVFFAGWEPTALMSFPLKLAVCPEGTRVRLALEATSDVRYRRLQLAFEAEMRELVSHFAAMALPRTHSLQ